MEHDDRDIPRPKPASAGGVRYEVLRNARMRGFAQAGGVIAAVDVKSKAERWLLQVYPVTYTPGEERDVQDVYITELKIDAAGKQLTVTNERGDTFHVDTTTREVSAIAGRK